MIGSGIERSESRIEKSCKEDIRRDDEKDRCDDGSRSRLSNALSTTSNMESFVATYGTDNYSEKEALYQTTEKIPKDEGRCGLVYVAHNARTDQVFYFNDRFGH